MRPPLKSASPAHNANGALSVAPRPVTSGMRRPLASTAMACRSSATCCRNAAAAQNSIFRPPKKCAAQPGVGAQPRHEQIVAARHVEVRRRRNLAQVGERRLEGARHRLPVVDVERAAVVENDADVVIAAEGVIPRQPVAQHRRLVREQRQHRPDHLLVRAEHPLRVDDAFRPAGRSGGVEHLCDRVGADAGVRVVDLAASAASPAARRRRWRAGSVSGACR